MIHADMTLAQIQAHSSEMAALEPWFFTHKFPGPGTLRESFGPCGENIADSLNSWAQRMKDGEQVFYDLYTQEEIAEEPTKAATKLLYVPGTPGTPFVVVIPGGAYRNVCSLVEGFPTAQLFTEQGYNAFILHYRVDRPKLFPEPMDDLAQAVRIIRAKAEEFQVDPDRYSVIGYSAGGHLAASWGTENHGYLHYGLPKPEMLFLGYPAASSEAFFEKGDVSETDFFFETWVGRPVTREACREYCVELHATKDYPPTYLVHSKDDPVVPWIISQTLAQTLQTLGVSHTLRIIEVGGHGFALGYGTDARDWIVDGIAFWKNLISDRH